MIKKKKFNFNKLMFIFMNIFFAIVLAFINYMMFITCNYYIIGIATVWFLVWLIVAINQ